MSDGRQGCPSASSASRYALCPGSFMLEQQAPAEPESDDARIGNRIHAALAGESVPDMTDEELAIYGACQLQEAGMHGRVMGDHTQEIREIRLWSVSGGNSWSGKPDVIYGRDGDDSWLVIDYKTGRGDVEEAAGNLQLRALAVLVKRRFAARHVMVAIIQPLASREPSVCAYNAEDLDIAGREIDEIMARVQQPGQPRVPSPDACKYCRAKAICPEAKAAALAVTRAESLGVLTGAELGDLLDRCRLAEQVVDAIRAEAKRRLENGETVPGWRLKPGPQREDITDPERVFSRFCGAGGTYAAFMSAVKITNGKLRDALKSATGDKGKAIDARMESILAGCTETKSTAPQLERIK